MAPVNACTRRQWQSVSLCNRSTSTSDQSLPDLMLCSLDDVRNLYRERQSVLAAARTAQGGSNTADRRWWECIKPKRVGKVKRCSAWTTHKKWISVLFFGYFTFYSISSIRQRLFTVEWCIKLNENYLTSNFCVEKFYRPKCRRQSRGRVFRMEWPAYP